MRIIIIIIKFRVNYIEIVRTISEKPNIKLQNFKNRKNCIDFKQEFGLKFFYFNFLGQQSQYFHSERKRAMITGYGTVK